MAKDEMTPTRRNFILALADSGMNISAAARKLFFNHSTVHYHIGIIKSITGLDPMNFYDLGKLVAMVKGSEDGSGAKMDCDEDHYMNFEIERKSSPGISKEALNAIMLLGVKHTQEAENG